MAIVADSGYPCQGEDAGSDARGTGNNKTIIYYGRKKDDLPLFGAHVGREV